MRVCVGVRLRRDLGRLTDRPCWTDSPMGDVQYVANQNSGSYRFLELVFRFVSFPE